MIGRLYEFMQTTAMSGYGIYDIDGKAYKTQCYLEGQGWNQRLKPPIRVEFESNKEGWITSIRKIGS